MAHLAPEARRRIRNAVVLACAVDYADKALLPAAFKPLAAAFNVGPKELGALAFAQSITCSLAMPVWGSLLIYFPGRLLLIAGCAMWATSTLFIALSRTFAQQLMLRLVNGAALAAVNPLSQALLCDIIPEEERGRAFGLVASANSLFSMIVGAAATATASDNIHGVEGWRLAHLCMAFASFGLALLLRSIIPLGVSRVHKTATGSWFGEQHRIVKTILKKPSFGLLVLQGVTGGIPWNALSFLTLYYQLSGYTDWQSSRLLLCGGVGGAVGGYIGGCMGDLAGRKLADTGRIMVAQASVLLGIICFAYVMHVRYSPTSFPVMASALFVFYFCASWAPSAACRPVCGVLFRDSQDRAQVLAFWIALEGISASFFGAPLAGMLSEAFGFKLTSGASQSEPVGEGGLNALRSALLGVALIPWIMCLLAWTPMYWTLPRDRVSEDASHKVDESEDTPNESSELKGLAKGPSGGQNISRHPAKSDAGSSS